MRNALIVLNYNDYKTVYELIDQVKDYSNIHKIIIVDNCSTDNSFEKLKKYNEYPKIDLIRTDSNRGYASGNNFGCNYAIEKYSPDYLYIANPDIVFSENILNAIMDVYKTKSDAGIVSCMMNCTSSINSPSAWKLPSYSKCVLEQLFLIKKFFKYSFEYRKDFFKAKLINVDVIPGSFFAIPTKVFKQVNGFDENTFLYYEENIISYKLRSSHKQNYLITDLEYTHNHSVSISKSIPSVEKKLRIAYDSRRYYCENYLKCNSIKLNFLRITFEIGLFNYKLFLKLKKVI